jgi:hypothetical protein
MSKNNAKKMKCSDEEFIHMVGEYCPKPDDSQFSIPYEEAEIATAHALVAKYIELKKQSTDEKFREYSDSVRSESTSQRSSTPKLKSYLLLMTSERLVRTLTPSLFLLRTYEPKRMATILTQKTSSRG